MTAPESVEHARANYGRIHGVICAQGMLYSTRPFATAEPEQRRRKFETDSIGFLNVLQARVPHMREIGGGSVTAIVSPTISRFVAGYGLAMTTKAALAGMIRYFAGEEGPHVIRVNAVGPGVIDTGIALELLEGPAARILDEAVAATPLRRRGRPEEVAELMVFLASQRAGYITGQIVNVDGGFSL